MRSLTVSLLLISFCVAQAQEDTLRFSAGTGWNYNVILDEAVSPMLYKGHGYSFQASMEKTKKKHSGRLSLTYQRARIQPGLENKSMEILYRGQLDWICVFRVKTASGFPVIHIGGHFLTSFHITDHEQWANNDFSHSFAFSLGPSLMANIPLFRKNKNLQLAWEFSFPLLDYVVRPGISSTLSEGTIKMGKSGTLATITGGRLTSIHEYQRLLSRMHLDWKITTNICLRIEYQWDYQQYNVNNVYKSANHMICTAVSFRLNKK